MSAPLTRCKEQSGFPWRWVLLFALFLTLWLRAAPLAAEPVVTELGREGGYRTIVETQTEGELSAEDFRQVSTLASRVVAHLNEAGRRLRDEQTENAERELKQAGTLVGIIRNLLPLTMVKTVVKDNSGGIVYQDEDRVQEDLIPLYEEMIAVEVVQPVIDVQSEETALQGMRLADANVLHTSVLLDLRYVESKLKRALSLLDQPEEALAQIVLAQTQGIRFAYDKQDTPLVKAQSALRMAERMINEGKIEAAEDNLRLARLHLEAYRTLIGQSESGPVRQLQEQITKLSQDAAVKGGAEEVRGFWDRVTGWLQKQPGEARQTTETNEPSK